MIAIFNLSIADDTFTYLPHSSYSIGRSGLGIFSTNIHWNWNVFAYFWKINSGWIFHSVTFNIQSIASIIILSEYISHFELAQMKDHFGWGWLVWSFVWNFTPVLRVIIILGNASYGYNITDIWEYLTESRLTDLLIPRRTKDLVDFKHSEHVSDFRNCKRYSFHE